MSGDPTWRPGVWVATDTEDSPLSEGQVVTLDGHRWSISLFSGHLVVDPFQGVPRVRIGDLP